MEFDSEEWRAERDRRLHEWVQDEAAVQFILDFANAAEFFDDVVDQDKEITRARAMKILFNVAAELPLNPFFDRYKGQLIPLIVAGINAWLDANEMEQGNFNDRVYAYVMRDFYMEMVPFIVYLTRGKKAMRTLSLEIRQFFTKHETLDQYVAKLEEKTA